jgi:CheY-like chemotaxis protein
VASEALDAVATFKPDVVLLDIGLPELDGYEVAQRLRASGSTVRLIALTGYGQAEDVQRTRAAGFDAHLVKPVDFAALERAGCGAHRRRPHSRLSGHPASPNRARAEEQPQELPFLKTATSSRLSQFASRTNSPARHGTTAARSAPGSKCAA